MEKNQFEVLVMAITGLKSEMNARFDQVDARFDQVDARFERIENRLTSVEQDTHAIRHQTAGTHETVTALGRRVAQLESPSA